jgi:hypothetical protein
VRKGIEPTFQPERKKRISQTARKFDDVQRELDETISNLKGTKDREFKRSLLQKMRRLLEEADRVLNSRP